MVTKVNNIVLELENPSIDGINMGGNVISNHGLPSSASDVANKLYVDNEIGAIPPPVIPPPIVDAGTKMLFQQTAAPVGWTKDVANNNKALRIVSGAVGSGGTDSFTTVFGVGKATGLHKLTIPEMPQHGHNYLGVTGDTLSGGGGFSGGFTSTSLTGGDGFHDHPLSNFDLQYVDVIVAIKD
jgi:hypothetical protein